MNKPPYSFKREHLIPLFHQTRLELQIIFLDLCKFCQDNKYPSPIITSAIRGRLSRSISDTHGEGRALDIRSWIYTAKEIDNLCLFINSKWSAQYGTGPDENNSKCLIYENIGKNSHMHLQVRR